MKMHERMSFELPLVTRSGFEIVVVWWKVHRGEGGQAVGGTWPKRCVMIAWGAEMSGAPQDWQGFKVQDRLVQHPIDIINDIEEKVCFHNMANWPLEVNLVCIDDFSWLWYIYIYTIPTFIALYQLQSVINRVTSFHIWGYNRLATGKRATNCIFNSPFRLAFTSGRNSLRVKGYSPCSCVNSTSGIVDVFNVHLTIYQFYSSTCIFTLQHSNFLWFLYSNKCCGARPSISSTGLRELYKPQHEYFYWSTWRMWTSIAVRKYVHSEIGVRLAGWECLQL
jgi:hypothetical protein